nr:general secretion pathway protein GspN [Stenotrophomonas indicatrix]
MKLEQISLRTGLLLALAGWAAAIWLATGFGLGSQLPTVSAEGDAQAALPALPVLAPERMAGADSYSVISERPLFAEDRKPRPYLLGGSETTASPALRLTGVLMTGDFSMATFTTEQGRSLRLRLNGDAVDGWQLVALEPRQATVIGSSGSQVLELAVFNGQGGEAPTALRGANGTPPVPGAVVPPPPPQPTPSQTPPPPPCRRWHCGSGLACTGRGRRRRTPCKHQRSQRSADAGHPRTHPGPPPSAAATAATTVAAPGRWHQPIE